MQNTQAPNRSEEDRSLKDLTPNAAALLCYLAGWITGIIFLVLEQKNRFVRFHSLQSIIVFGILTLAGGILAAIPVVGQGFQWAISVLGLILWIILMVKAYHGEVFKIPWAGDLAEKLTNDSMPYRPAGTDGSDSGIYASTASGPMAAAPPQAEEPKPEQPAGNPTQSIPVEPVMPIAPPPASSYQRVEPIAPAKNQAGKQEFREKYYSVGEKTARMVGSAFSIAWAVVLVIFFNFYNEYIAYYHVDGAGGITVWQRDSILTSEFTTWLPIVTTALILSIIGHSILIAYDRYIARRITQMILDIMGAVTVISLLVIYPFDFYVIPNHLAVTGVNITVTVVLIVMAVAFIISALVKFIQTIVHAVEGKF